MAYVYAAQRMYGGSRKPSGYYTPGPNYIPVLIKHKKAEENYKKALKAYNNNKRAKSGGIRGYFQRRFGAQASQMRANRNAQLNTRLKNNMNRAKATLNSIKRSNNYWHAKRWYNGLFNHNRRVANENIIRRGRG